jgi:leucyl/phenylalanyl-tRNA---protein transferase
MTSVITPELLLRAYAAGVFPMSDSADDPGLYWVDPDKRGVMPLDGFHAPRRLQRTVRQDRFEVRVDTDFDAVITGCAGFRATQPETWINGRIRALYGELFRLGHVHTVECWRDGRLTGGLYGVSLGAAFFGESMFHAESDASKVALVHLVARLRRSGYLLLDTQFMTGHLSQFGAVEVPRARYRQMLGRAVSAAASAGAWARPPLSGAEALSALAEDGRQPPPPSRRAGPPGG